MKCLTISFILSWFVIYIHALQCPVPVGSGICVELCRVGYPSDCPIPGQLCCSNGCGHTCQAGCTWPACDLACPAGQMLARDHYGCVSQACYCVPDPNVNVNCDVLECPYGYFCDETQGSAICQFCPVYSCPSCPPGYHNTNTWDSNGCQQCECATPCATVRCPSGHVCEVEKESSCTFEPCRYVAVCKERATPTYVQLLPGGGCPSTCTTNDNCHPDEYICCQNSCGGSSCVRGVCGPVCEIGCPLGQELKKDKHGCRICQCVSICENTNCGFGHYCEVTNTVSGLQPTCKACPIYDCQECPAGWGYRISDNGCTSCECFDVCENNNCGPQERCVAQEVTCVTSPCNPVPTCVISGNCGVNSCPPCGPGEAPLRDSDGCQIQSQCCFNPCAAVTCVVGDVCTLEQPPCLPGSPCDPIAVCKRGDECSPTPCRPCDHGLVPMRDSNGCRYTNCQCINPCQSVRCYYWEKCAVIDVDCRFNYPCDPVPKCIPVGAGEPTATINSVLVLIIAMLYCVL